MPGEEIKNPVGRPSEYNQEIASQLCAQLAEGISLRTVCKSPDMPGLSTVFKWLHKHPEFVEQYARAKEESAEAMAEDILDIADDGTNDWMTIQKGKLEIEVPDKEVIMRSRLRVDTRKWLMSKMKPKKYGEKLDMTTDGQPLTIKLVSYGDNNSASVSVSTVSTPDTPSS